MNGARIAELLLVTTAPWREEPPEHEVSQYVLWTGHFQAECSCGWARIGQADLVKAQAAEHRNAA